jgi:aspartyl-tRNA(Asn)/glutamyl-tRNA(Gln) amidotransferase subunit C
MSITPGDLLRVARLAELEVAEADAARLAGELDRIVTYVGQLQALGQEGQDAREGFHPGPERVALRPDQVGSVPLVRPPEAIAPEFADGFFLVPRLPAMEPE